VKRTYKDCLDLKYKDPYDCEIALCIAVTKLNKNYEYRQRALNRGCRREFNDANKIIDMNRSLWNFNNGAHPEEWDSEGIPEHALKVKERGW
jgi:hypothetical protein